MSLIVSAYCSYFFDELVADYVFYYTAQLIFSWATFYANKGWSFVFLVHQVVL